jgi:phage terminase large subunit-like protein
MTKAEQYEQQVQAGHIPACTYVHQAISRHQADLQRRDIYFDSKPGEVAAKFFNILQHYKGSFRGQNFELSSWQHWLISRLLGWKKADGTRRYTDLYLEVPRKNGKTSLLAGLALYLMLMDGESAPEIYTAATKEDQAKLLIDEAAKISKQTPGLKKYLKYYTYNGIHRLIQVQDNNGFAKPLGRDSDTQDGLNVFAGMIDEYHAHKDNGIVDVLKSGAGARVQPIIAIITTAGFDKERPAYQYRKHVTQVLAGEKTQDNLLALIYTTDASDNWREPATWKKANPNYGISVMPAYLEGQANEAIANPSKQVNFKTKHLNIWTDAEDVWIDSHIWSHGNQPAEIPAKAYRAPAYGGLDLASGFDFNAFVLSIPCQEATYYPAWFWIPEGRLKQHAENNPNILQWAKDGYIRTIPGDVMDWNIVASEIMQIHEQFNIESIAFDRYKADHGVIQNLMQSGLPDSKLDPYAQTVTNMNEPTGEFERRAINREIKHFGNPVLRWMLSNTTLYTDTNGNRKPNRQNTHSQKIDGIVAAVMATGEELTILATQAKNKPKQVRIRTLKA